MQPYKIKAYKRRAKRFTRETLIPGIIKLLIASLIIFSLLELAWYQFDRELTRRECLVYKTRSGASCAEWVPLSPIPTREEVTK
jgi:hypothetical protein